MVKPNKEKCAYKMFYGKITDCAKHLRTFGEIGVVRSITRIKYKLDNQVMMCKFLGYAPNNTGGTYRILNLRTKCIVLRRDIIWLNKT